MDDFTTIYFDGMRGRTSGSGFVLDLVTHKYVGRDADGLLVEEKRTVTFTQEELSGLFGEGAMAAIRAKINSEYEL